MGIRSKRSYVSFTFRAKSVPQLALLELNVISQFNFNLVLPDIVANKTLGESDLPGKLFFQSYVSKPFFLDPLPWWSGAIVFQFCLWFAFRLYHHTGQLISSPDLALSFRSVLWQMDVSKWYSCQRCTNADLKISLCYCAHIKTIPSKRGILNPKNSRVIYEWSL